MQSAATFSVVAGDGVLAERPAPGLMPICAHMHVHTHVHTHERSGPCTLGPCFS